MVTCRGAEFCLRGGGRFGGRRGDGDPCEGRCRDSYPLLRGWRDTDGSGRGVSGGGVRTHRETRSRCGGLGDRTGNLLGDTGRDRGPEEGLGERGLAFPCV